ncbi:MAG: molybdenum cofactor guanylyltransferase [Acidimicrobiia bacterium]|nr:molybdenum cofactor guanylyltransferase [Acidimicrobiia bacterium]
MSRALLSAPDLVGVVISGGRSERLGRDKAREEIGGVRLLDRVLAALGEVVETSVVVGPWAPPGVARTEEMPRFEGPLRAFAHAARVVPASRLLLVGCDHPFLQPDLLRHLASRRTDADVVVAARPEGPEPLLGVYATDLADMADGLLECGVRSLKKLIESARSALVEETEWRVWDPEGLSFVDIDDPPALERARRLCEGSTD